MACPLRVTLPLVLLGMLSACARVLEPPARLCPQGPLVRLDTPDPCERS